MRQLSVFSCQFSVFSLLLSILFAGACGAEEIAFEATVDRPKVSLGENVELNLTFYGTQGVSTPYFPGVEGFNWRYLGPAHLTSIINGEVSTSITHRYLLVPLREGSFMIPSFSVQYRGQTYTSQPIPIEVLSHPVSRAQVSPRQSPQQRPDDLEDLVFIVIQAEKRQAYVNEIIPISIKLYVNNLALRDIQYPQLEHQGFSLDEYQSPLKYQEALRGVLHSVIEFRTQAFATRVGELVLGPAHLECNLLIKDKSRRRSNSSFFDDFFDDDFFARYSTYPLSLQSAEVPIKILELPEEGRPADFTGAIGSYRFSASAEPRKVKVGDPITLRMEIAGDGNLTTAKAPELQLGDAFKVYEPDIRQEQDRKIIEQVIIPKDSQVSEIPQIGFSFFNPRSQEYKTLTQGPLSIEVSPLPEGEKLQVFESSEPERGALRRKEILGRDIIYIKDTPGKISPKGAFVYKNRLFILLQLLPLLTLIAVLVTQRRKQRLENDIGYARRLRAPRKAKKGLARLKGLLAQGATGQFFDLLFKTLQEYLGDRFHLSSAGITANVIEDLKSRQVDPEILSKLKECFNACDLARYAPGSFSKADLEQSLGLLEEIFDRLERWK